MLIQPYHTDELKFAWCYQVFFRWRTWRRVPVPSLAGLTAESLNPRLEQYQVRLLEYGSDALDIRALVSLQPQESTATAASKNKGQLCKAVGEQVSSNQKSFTRGYAVTSLKFHIVLATWKRQGVFTAEVARAIDAHWRDQQARLRVVFDKFFLPDHVHIAVEVHPTASPARLVTELMNASQVFAFENFPENVARAKVERLWQPSAHIGSFGDLTTAATKSYIDRWCRASTE